MSFESDLESAMSSAFSGRFYGDVPTNATRPYAHYQVIADTEQDRFLAGRTAHAAYRVQITIIGTRRSELISLATAARSALESTYGDQLRYYERGADLDGDDSSDRGRLIDFQVIAAA